MLLITAAVVRNQTMAKEKGEKSEERSEILKKKEICQYTVRIHTALCGALEYSTPNAHIDQNGCIRDTEIYYNGYR